MPKNTIRTVTLDDAMAMRAIYEPYVVSSAVTFDDSVPNEAYFRDAIRERSATYPWLVAESAEGLPVGYAYASQHLPRAAYRWSVEVSIYLAATHHQQGIGRQLYNELFRILKRQGFRMAYAGITIPNEGSIGIHESFGFRRVALYPNTGFKHGRWHDVGWWALDLMPDASQTAEPSEPIPFAQLRFGPAGPLTTLQRSRDFSLVVGD